MLCHYKEKLLQIVNDHKQVLATYMGEELCKELQGKICEALHYVIEKHEQPSTVTKLFSRASVLMLCLLEHYAVEKYGYEPLEERIAPHKRSKHVRNFLASQNAKDTGSYFYASFYFTKVYDNCREHG